MTAVLLDLAGDPTGGVLDVFVQRDVGDAVEVQVATYDGEPLRLLAERLVDALETSGLARPAEIDRAEQLVVINGGVDADVVTDDAGVLVSLSIADGEVVADNRVRGSAGGAARPADAASDPDAEVLRHLDRYVAALADNAAAAGRLDEEIRLNQTLYFEVVRSLLEGRSDLQLPNPGSGTPRVADAGRAMDIANEVSAHVAKMIKHGADMTDARGKQVEAIEAKEREAKSGGGVGGSKTARGGGVGTTGAPAPAPSGETGAPGGTPAGGGAGDAPAGDGVLVRDAGSGSEYATAIPIEELTLLRGRGLEFVVGRIGSQWYLSVDRRSKEYLVDGKTLVRSEHHFGDFRPDAPEDERPIPVDLDALIAALEKDDTPPEGTEPSGAATVLSLALDFIPIIGDVKGVVEVAIGRDLITNQQLSTTERALGATLMLIPFAGRLFRGAAKAGLRTTGSVVRVGGQVGEASIRQADEAIEALAAARRSDGKSVIRRRLDDADDSPLPAPAYGRAGCFTPDTLVVTDGGHVPIGSLSIGEKLLAASGAARVPRIDDVRPAEIVSIRRRTVPSIVRLEITAVETDRTVTVTCTPRHPIATTTGYVAAVDLADHHRLLLADGTAVLTRRTVVGEPREVVNLEVDEHHTFFVSELAVLVHNHCEKVSQRYLDHELTQIMDHAHVRPDGTPILEPAYRNGQFLGYGHRSTRTERAAALGVPLDGSLSPEAVKRALKEGSADSTKPDFAGQLRVQWGDLPQGTRVNVELKTIKDTQYGRRRSIYEQMAILTDGGKRNKGSLLTQSGMRTRQVPGEHVLVIDVSYAEGFRPGAMGPQVQQALGELQAVMNARNLPYGGADGLASAYPRVAFMVQDASGAVRVSAPVPMPVRQVD